MPTVLLLDVSLSMSRLVPQCEGTEDYTRRHLAVHGLNCFLDYLTANNRLEYVAMVIFSSLDELVVPFTRNYESIKSALNNVENYDKTCIDVGLFRACATITSEWGTRTPSQIILITDGSTSVGSGSLKHLIASHDQPTDSTPPSGNLLPFSIPCDLHIVCLADAAEYGMNTTIPLYHRLIQLTGHQGQIYTPEGGLTLKTVQNMFDKLSENHFQAFHGKLKCGHLSCNVHVFPKLENYNGYRDHEHIQIDVSEEIEVCGFLRIADMASPPFISRHLMLPMSNTPENESTDLSDKINSPSFTVLLHGSLKVEGMVALCLIGNDWYGMLYSWADPHKKKSNLMLSVFDPGVDALPWLGKLDQLVPHTYLTTPPPYGEDDNKTPFPVKLRDKRSYSLNHVGWIKPSGLQSDIQKVLRHARKLPDKLQQFYKELNRVRKAALSFGFTELLDALSAMLDRECTLLPGTAHPDAALQLSHAANMLRTESARDITQTIVPMTTNYKVGIDSRK